MKQIALHTFHYCNTPARVSTVQFSENCYETMVMFDDGDELECIRTYTAEDACKVHNEVMNRWNDRIYEGSTAKLLGALNLGQFMHPVITC
jgi:L-lactate utilization protein LutB